MDTTLGILLTSAVTIGFIHTLIGVDHSLPFVVLGRAQRWPLRKVVAVTGACGLAHVLSSVVLGAVGIGVGASLSRLTWIEGSRGDLAAWVLIAFGLAYTGWSLARRRRRHRHVHTHGAHVHAHKHTGAHHHDERSAPFTALTGWSLFVIFVLGPCEPLIPLVIAPSIDLGIGAAILVATVFGVTTIATMMTVVAVGYLGLGLPAFRKLEGYSHTLAGLAIAASGIVIRLTGL